MKKKNLRFAAAALMALWLCCFAQCALALTNSIYSLEYETFVSGGSTQVRVTGVVSKSKTSYTVPATLGGYPVTAIGASAFESCSAATSITLPSSVTTLAGSRVFAGCTSLLSMDLSGITDAYEMEGMFTGCTALQSVKLPSSLTVIGDLAFKNCSSLTSINVPSGLTEIGYCAFQHCRSLKKFSLPRTLVKLDDNAFDNVPLENVRLPAALTSIGEYALNSVTFASSLLLPEGLTELGRFAFITAKNLPKYLVLPTTLTTLGVDVTPDEAGIGFAVIEGSAQETLLKNRGADYAYYQKQPVGTSGLYDYFVHKGDTLLFGMRTGGSSTMSVMIPDGMTAIADGAYENAVGISSVTFPEGLTAIGENAFAGVTLYSISFPQSLTSIGAGAFPVIKEGRRVTLGEGITSIGADAFPRETVLFVKSGSAAEAYAIEHGNPYGLEHGDFVISSDGKTLYHYSGSETDVVIPDGVEIIDGAFYGNEQITSVVMPDSVKVLDGKATNNFGRTVGAFQGCRALEQVTMSKSLVTIGENAFSTCTALGRMDIPYGVTSIGDNAFFNCNNLTEIEIPNSLTRIGSSAFDSCYSLTDFEIPDSVTEIGNSAFYDCYSLKYVELPSGLTAIAEYLFTGTDPDYIGIPAGVTTVGTNAFEMCTVPALYLPSGITSVGEACFYGPGELYCASGSTTAQTLEAAGYTYSTTVPAADDLTIEYVTDEAGNDVLTVTKCAAAATSVVIPEGVKAIASMAFNNCKSLESVTIPYGVKSIGNLAFYGCSKLGELTLPSSVTALGSSFAQRGILLYVHASSAAEAFAQENGFAHAVLEENPTVQDGFVLTGTKLCKYVGSADVSSITVPQGVTEIGPAALAAYGSVSAVQEIILPQTLETIGAYGLGDYSAVIAIPDSVTSIGRNAAGTAAVLIVSEGSPAHVWAQGQDRTGFIVSDGGITRENGFLMTGSTLLRYMGSDPVVTIPDGITAIADQAFYTNTTLKTVNVPQTLTSVGDYAFSGCSALESCDLPSGVTQIGNAAFGNCTALADFDMPQSLVQLGGSAFDGCTSLTGEIDIHGVTDIPAYAFSNCQDVTGFVLSDNLQSIGEHAFALCRSLRQLDIPDTVTSIGDFALLYTGITSLEIPQGVTRIGEGLFMECSSLERVGVPAGVTSIGEYAFTNCSALKDISLPEGLEQIEAYGFYNCSSLAQIRLPSTLKKLGEEAFDSCSALKSVEIPGGVETIERNAFEACVSLEDVVIGEGVKAIGDYAFHDCLKLRTVSLPKSLTSIGVCALYGGAFTELHLPCNIQSVGDSFVDTDGLILCCTPGSMTAATLDAAGYSHSPIRRQEGALTYETVMSGADTEARIVVACDPAAMAVEIPADVVAIGENAFAGCTALASLILPEGLGEIQAQAFADCTALADLVVLGRRLALDDAKIAPVSGRTVYGYIGSTAENYAAARGYGFAALDAPTGLDAYSEGGSKVTVSWFAMGEVSGYEVYGANAEEGEYALAASTQATEIAFEEGAYAYYKVRPYVDVPAGRAYGEFTAAVETYVVEYEIVGSELVRMYLDQEEVVVPEGVTRIGASAFAGNADTKRIILPETVESIGMYAFEGCALLEEINIPDGVAQIGAGAFTGCTSLAHVILPDGVSVIGENAFGTVIPVCRADTQTHAAIEDMNADHVVIQNGLHILVSGGTKTITGCDAEASAVSVPADVTAIADGAFGGCAQMTSLYIPENVTSIGANAFAGCEALAEIAVMNGGVTVGKNAFATGCAGRVIGYPAGGADEAAAAAGYTFCSLAFSGTLSAAWNGAVELAWTADENAQYTEVWCAPLGSAFYLAGETEKETYTDTQNDYNSAYKIRRVFAFAGSTIAGEFSATASVSVPGFTVNAAGTLTAYTGAGGDVLVPASVKQIAGGVFRRKSAVTSVAMVSGLTTIGVSAFEQCTALSSVTLPDTLTTIGDKAFYNCTVLASITLPDAVTSVGANAFAANTVIRCKPGSTTAQTLTAAGYAWQCISHRRVVYEAVPPTHKTEGRTKGSACVACGTVFTQQQTIAKLDLPVMQLPSSLKYIEEEAFAGSAEQIVELPDGCLEIGPRAFADCASLRVVEIPASVTAIADTAFDGCSEELVVLTVSGSEACRYAANKGMQVVATHSDGSVYNSVIYNIDWFTYKNVIISGTGTYKLTDILTGRVFSIKVQSAGNHADVEPLTADDTEVLCSLYGVADATQQKTMNKWQRRAVVMTNGNGEQFVGSIYAIPHGTDTVSDNAFDGQFCVHLLGSTMHAGDGGSVSDSQDHQAKIAAGVDALISEGIRVSATYP